MGQRNPSGFSHKKKKVDFPFGRRAKPSRILYINLSDNLYIGKSRPDFHPMPLLGVPESNFRVQKR